jgi:hypothetical protein
MLLKRYVVGAHIVDAVGDLGHTAIGVRGSGIGDGSSAARSDHARAS